MRIVDYWKPADKCNGSMTFAGFRTDSTSTSPQKAATGPYFLNKPAFAWVEKHLGMPKFDAEAVQRLPEVYLGDWTDAHEIDIGIGL